MFKYLEQLLTSLFSSKPQEIVSTKPTEENTKKAFLVLDILEAALSAVAWANREVEEKSLEERRFHVKKLHVHEVSENRFGYFVEIGEKFDTRTAIIDLNEFLVNFYPLEPLTFMDLHA